MTIDKAKLKALAQAASQSRGARRVEVDHNGVHVIGDGSWKILSAWRTPDGKGAQNAEFAAAASPATILALLAEIERLEVDNGSMRGSTKRMGEDASKAQKKARKAQREIDRLKAENEAMRSALLEASEEVATWGAYASEYFQEKHDLAGCVAKIHAAAMAKEASHDHE
ncbi:MULTISPECIES: ead/Ea22-like family protein [Pseudomonas]|uniref:ead/Ea22-like family protein n=1 Tax=Pseudomonas TaxID=286 RepID=UPI0015B624A3|nr:MULTISPECIES: ead/Ea22-like family protein [Pseudomonas]KAF4559217.1 hypothetical protein HBJ16_003219 [Pseudomonas sp. CES]MBF8786644.1 hypothetical protein [Pseudomonas asiatica]